MTSKIPLKKESFRLFDAAKFPFTCAVCSERYSAGTPVYWKREVVGPNEFHTTTICPRCFKES